MGHEGCDCHGHCCCYHEEDKKKLEFDDDMTNSFVDMANKAWEALFMEKARAHWEKIHGKQLDEMAKASVQASFDYHMRMMESEKQKAEVVKKMNSFMG